MRIRPLAVLLLLLALVAAACSGAERADEAVDDDPAAMEPEPEVDEPADDEAPDSDDAGTGVAGDRDTALPPAPARPASGTPERIIKEGTITLEVDEDGFLAAYERVVEAARRLGGAITASTSTTDDAGRTTGSLTVRVPVESYEDLLVGVGRIGDLRHQDITSQDVTGEVVDIQARLRHLRAQEGFYLGLLEDAEGVQDAITVQQHVDDIQQRIEQLQGRLDLLEDRAAYSTLTVELVEVGAEPILAARDGEPTLAAYAQAARNGFITVVGWLLVVGASLAPVVVPLLAALAVWRMARRRPVVPATVAPDAE